MRRRSNNNQCGRANRMLFRSTARSLSPVQSGAAARESSLALPDIMKRVQTFSLAAALRLWPIFVSVAACGPSAPPPVALVDSETLDDEVVQLVERVRREVEKDPANAAAHGKLGLVFEANQLWDEAEQSFANAVKLDTSDPLWAYHQAIALRQAGETQRALALLQSSALRLANMAGPQYRLGVALLEADRVDEAEQAFERTRALLPTIPDPYLGLGEVELHRENYAAALPLLEKAVALEPSYKTAHYALGLALRGVGRTDEAALHLAEGLGGKRRYIPDALEAELRTYAVNFSGQFERATNYVNSGQANKGIAILEKLLVGRPNDTNVLNNLANGYIALRDYERAVTLLERAAGVNDTLFPTYINLAACYLGMQRLDDALVAADRAVELAPEMGRAHLKRAEILVALNRLQDAYSALKSCVRYDARDGGAFIALGQVCARTHKNAEAVEHLLTGIRLKPDSILARTELGLVYLRLGEGEKALATYREVQPMAPESPQVHALKRQLEQRGLRP